MLEINLHVPWVIRGWDYHSVYIDDEIEHSSQKLIKIPLTQGVRITKFQTFPTRFFWESWFFWMGQNGVFYGDEQPHKPRCRVPEVYFKHNKKLAHLYKNPETYRHRGLLEVAFWLLGGRNSKLWQKLVWKIWNKRFKNAEMVDV